LAAVLDTAMRPLYPARREVVPLARGEVIEIGVGTGLNLSLYGQVERVIGVDPDPHMLARARARMPELAIPIELYQTGAERLPFDAGRFDTAVITFTLCTIPEPPAALAEVRRVLKPGGQLLFAEHTRSVQPAAAWVQDVVTPLWKRVGGGCHLNRPAVELMREAGFVLGEVVSMWRERWTLMPVYRGVATKGA
jgi:ubiquinone/menaquinone biosynthesis C-methylase UbiE